MRLRTAIVSALLLSTAFLVGAHYPFHRSMPLALAVKAPFGAGQEIMRLPAGLDEVSGMGESRNHPGVFWVHNDSGDEPRVYAVSRSGKLLGTYALKGATATDWEDMAIGPAATVQGVAGSYLYLADIGDNSARRRFVRIYRVPEPEVDQNQAAASDTLTDWVSFDFTYPDGARDAEGFMVDPLTGDFYIVSKREGDGNRLYRAAAPGPGQPNTLIFTGVTFPFTQSTGAEISPDGLQVLIRRYSLAEAPTAGSYWKRPDASLSLPDLLKQPAQTVALSVEIQGEAIAFAASNRGFYTTTERGPGNNPPLAPVTFYPIAGE